MNLTAKSGQSKLTPKDYEAFGRSWITPAIADAAGVYRVNSIDGRELVGRHGGGDFGGLVFPYRWPGETHSTLNRLRLDTPPIGPNGKPEHKYLTATGSRNRVYCPPCPPELLTDAGVPVVFSEGEKKCLALWRMALEAGNGTGQPVFLPVSVPGVWAWRGTIGATNAASGERMAVKGTIPDLDRIPWAGRKVTILFDSNTASNSSVAAARRELIRELARRGAAAYSLDLPGADGVNGCDDYLALHGSAKLAALLETAAPFDWRRELKTNDKGKVNAILANAISALRYAPDWYGVLAWDAFASRCIARRATPWGFIGTWDDQADRRTCEWLQKNGILVKVTEAGQAVQTVAKDELIHPVREYLDSLKWDGTQRIDDWLTLYCGAEPSEFIQATGARWLISAVARIASPGCKADCVLVFEARQGAGKSTTFRILGGDWYSDDIASLDSKDAAIGLRGRWIVEFAELDAVSRSTASRIKAFISRAEDYIRLPYDRHCTAMPRESVFGGTINAETYLFDETGARRFWPVTCGRIELDALRRDRDQLWAEAVVRYRGGAKWWLDSEPLVTAAETEQSARYADDPWEPPVARWLDGREDASISEILKHAIGKPTEHWTQADRNRVGRILTRIAWNRYRKRVEGTPEWRYKP